MKGAISIRHDDVKKILLEDPAQRIGTQKSNISRFENGSCNPSLDFLARVAQGLGKELHIELR